jgi:hypothetical protein
MEENLIILEFLWQKTEIMLEEVMRTTEENSYYFRKMSYAGTFINAFPLILVSRFVSYNVVHQTTFLHL